MSSNLYGNCDLLCFPYVFIFEFKFFMLLSLFTAFVWYFMFTILESMIEWIVSFFIYGSCFFSMSLLTNVRQLQENLIICDIFNKKNSSKKLHRFDGIQNHVIYRKIHICFVHERLCHIFFLVIVLLLLVF